MRYFPLQWACALALLIFPIVGCGDSGPDGKGGTGGGGTGGAAGTAGTSGAGGGGTGGAEPITAGLWMGSGTEGPGAPWTICFGVNEDGSALTAIDACQDFALQVAFNGCAGSVSTRPDPEIQIVNGSFQVVDALSDIMGTFDGDTATGQGSFMTAQGTCTNDWTATPSR